MLRRSTIVRRKKDSCSDRGRLCIGKKICAPGEHNSAPREHNHDLRKRFVLRGSMIVRRAGTIVLSRSIVVHARVTFVPLLFTPKILSRSYMLLQIQE